MPTVSTELRQMLPTGAIAVLLPMPLATFWQDGSGRAFAYAYLFLGCAIMAAERFAQRSTVATANSTAEDLPQLWRAKMTALALAMAGAVSVFTAFVWTMNGQRDFTVPVLAVLAVVPALGCVPYLAIVTARSYAAVLFTLFLLGLVKLTGCAVVRIVYGPHALAEGRMALPWEQPNFLVWFCLAGAMSLSALLYPLGRRAFRKRGELLPLQPSEAAG